MMLHYTQKKEFYFSGLAYFCFNYRYIIFHLINRTWFIVTGYHSNGHPLLLFTESIILLFTFKIALIRHPFIYSSPVLKY